MKTYLELEGKLGPKPRSQAQTQLQPSTSAPSQNNNSLTRKTPGPKMAEKKRRTRVPEVRVIVQPIPTTPTTSMPMNPISNPTVTTSTTSTQMPMVKSAVVSIQVTVYNLAQGKFKGRLQVEESPSPPMATHHNLKLHPVPQPSRSERHPLT